MYKTKRNTFRIFLHLYKKKNIILIERKSHNSQDYNVLYKYILYTHV